MDDAMIKAFVTLVAGVGALGAILYFVKKYSGKFRNDPENIGLEVISKVSLQPKSHLFVVKAKGKTLLLGATEHNVSILSELEGDADLNGQMQRVKNKLAHSKQLSRENSISKNDDDSLSFTSFIKSAFSGK